MQTARLVCTVSAKLGRGGVRVNFESGPLHCRLRLPAGPKPHFRVRWEPELALAEIQVYDLPAVQELLPRRRILEHWPNQYLESLGALNVSGDGTRWTMSNVTSVRQVFRLVHGIVRPRAPWRKPKPQVVSRRKRELPPAYSYRIDWKKGEGSYSHPKGHRQRIVTQGPP